MPEAGVIKGALIGLFVLFVIALGIGTVITYWYWFLLAAVVIGGGIFAMKHKTRMSNRV